MPQAARGRMVQANVSECRFQPKEIELTEEKLQMTLSAYSRRCAVMLVAALASFITYAQSKLPADLDPQSRARLPYLRKSEMDAKGPEDSRHLSQQGWHPKRASRIRCL